MDDWVTHLRSLTPLQRYSRCILQYQPTGQPGHSFEESYPAAEIQSVYSAVPTDWTTRTLIWGVLPRCRDTVGVFCSTNRLDNQDTHLRSLTPLQRYSRCILQYQPTGQPGHSFEESYPAAEIQPVYSAVPTDWTTRTLIWGVLPRCRDTAGVFCSTNRLAHYGSEWLRLVNLYYVISGQNQFNCYGLRYSLCLYSETFEMNEFFIDSCCIFIF